MFNWLKEEQQDPWYIRGLFISAAMIVTFATGALFIAAMTP